MSLTGQNVFITGGALGIGRAFTEVLLAEGANKVYIADKNEAAGRATLSDLQAEYGEARCSLLLLDVTHAKQFEDAFQTAVDQSGHIDLMVNNAGRFNEMDWEPVVQLNLISCIRGSELAMRHMNRKSGGRGGRIINTCSNMGCVTIRHFSGSENNHGLLAKEAGLGYTAALPVYSATKHGVRAFTAGMAMHPDQSETGVQLASICPGPVHTDLFQSFNSATARYADIFRQETEEATTPSRIAEAFLKLVRLPVINGAILYIDETKCEFCKLEYVGLGPDWTQML